MIGHADYFVTANLTYMSFRDQSMSFVRRASSCVVNNNSSYKVGPMLPNFTGMIFRLHSSKIDTKI